MTMNVISRATSVDPCPIVLPIPCPHAHREGLLADRPSRPITFGPRQDSEAPEDLAAVGEVRAATRLVPGEEPTRDLIPIWNRCTDPHVH